MNKTSIEWCDYTVNPIRFRPFGSQRTVTMCQKISPGCANCYAADITRRFWPKDADASPFPGYTAQGLASGNFVLDEKLLQSVLRHKAPCRLFWGDMTDLFGDWVPDAWMQRILAVCALTPQIEHIFLTKRPDAMATLLGTQAWTAKLRADAVRERANLVSLDRGQGHFTDRSGFPMSNVILGCSVESQQYADERREPMAALAAMGWRTLVSYEPALGGVHWKGWEFLNWLISGGESGSKARPSNPDWHRAARDFCAANEIPYFFKQWGNWEPYYSIHHGPFKYKRFIDWKGRVLKPDEPNPDGTDLRDWERIARVSKKAPVGLLDGEPHYTFAKPGKKEVAPCP